MTCPVIPNAHFCHPERRASARSRRILLPAFTPWKALRQAQNDKAVLSLGRCFDKLSMTRPALHDKTMTPRTKKASVKGSVNRRLLPVLPRYGMFHIILSRMGGRFAHSSLFLAMPPILIPPHKKRQQQNAAAIKRCYPIHPCHHLCLLFLRCLCIWERQSKGSCAPIGRMRILGETCLQMRFCKQTLLCIGRNRSFFLPCLMGNRRRLPNCLELPVPQAAIMYWCGGTFLLHRTPGGSFCFTA